MNPRFGDIDPYWMAASAIDEAVRNCVAVGADPRRIAILDNFCWGNTDRPETLGTLVRAALGCHDIAIAYGTPFISGKDSLNNEFSYVDETGSKRTVAIPPSLLISALGQMEDITRAVTMDLKQPGNLLYLVGRTGNELGGSHFHLVSGLAGGEVPRVNPELAPRIFAAAHEAMQRELIRSCHDLSEGGLAVAAAEMAFAGEFGVELDLQALANAGGLSNDAVLLFSESNTRFLIEVPESRAAEVEAVFRDLPLARLGRVQATDRVQVRGTGGSLVIDVPWPELKEAWQRPLAWD
jgi:phosphoribosylformylglycinamidine synthase